MDWTPIREKLLGEYAANGREAVNMIQMSAGIAREAGRRTIQAKDVKWVVEAGQYLKRPVLRLGRNSAGCVNGLAVYGSNIGTIIEIETVAVKASPGMLTVTGLIDEEELGYESKKFRRKSTSKSSVDNVLTALKKNFGIDSSEYFIHINMPGSAPIDGPSAGMAIAVSVFSAITGHAVKPSIAMTGEISINGCIRAVGGVKEKIAAAKRAGASMVIIPMENMREVKIPEGISVIGANDIYDVIKLAFSRETAAKTDTEILSAKGIENYPEN